MTPEFHYLTIFLPAALATLGHYYRDGFPAQSLRGPKSVIASWKWSFPE